LCASSLICIRQKHKIADKIAGVNHAFKSLLHGNHSITFARRRNVADFSVNQALLQYNTWKKLQTFSKSILVYLSYLHISRPTSPFVLAKIPSLQSNISDPPFVCHFACLGYPTWSGITVKACLPVSVRGGGGGGTSFCA
jgi:hypothetical protein